MFPAREVRDPDTGYPVTVNKATVLRLELSIPPGKPPLISDRRCRQRLRPAGRQGCLPDRPDRPGARAGRHALCVRRARQPDRRHPRCDDAHDQRRHRPRGHQGRPAAAAAGLDPCCRRSSAGCNALNGQVVEIDPATGKQLYAQWIDANQAQSPPGNGDLFGIAHDAGRQGLLLRRGRHEHPGGGDAMSTRDDKRPARPAAAWSAPPPGSPRRRVPASASAAPPKPWPRRSRCRPGTRRAIEPFWGEHQGGIVTPAQSHTYFAAFDLDDRQARRGDRAAAGLDRGRGQHDRRPDRGAARAGSDDARPRYRRGARACRRRG